MSARQFSSTASACGRTACSIVEPVHHTVRFRKKQLMTKFPNLLKPKSDIDSPYFKPQRWGPDRVRSHYDTVVASDLLLINYQHDQQRIEGNKPRPRSGESPYHLYQPKRAPYGGSQASKDLKPRDWTNVPHIEKLTLNCFVKAATQNHDYAIAAKVMLQQVTGQKPRTIYARTNVPQWTLRPGMPMGAKVELKGQPMNQFLSTLTEIVLPRSKTFQGISNTAGDQNGNIVFSLTPDDLRLFPELEGNLELWPQSFGIDVFFHTSAQVDPEARTLVSAYGFPFEGKERFPKKM